MAKRKTRETQKRRAPVAGKKIIGVVAGVVLVATIILLITQSGRSYAITILMGTPTLTPSPTPTATSTPTTTPTSTFTPVPTLTPTPLPPATATPTSSSTPLPTDTPEPAAAPALQPEETAEVPVYGFKIINTYPHDPNAYIQGLVYENGFFYEGTGLKGRSTLRKVELETGKVLQLTNLLPELFGEGITIFGDRIIQLTWHAGIGFVYDQESFELLQLFNYPTEGWGITHDGERLIMSDGTANLYFWDPDSLAEIGRVEVFDNGQPVTWLNELEYINGEIFANVWQTDRIARIDPDTGRVVGWIDLTGLQSPEDRSQQRGAVLNGIAYDADNDRLFVTGKLWPKLYEIELIPTE